MTGNNNLLRIFMAALFVFLCQQKLPAQWNKANKRLKIAGEMKKSIRTELLEIWYPSSADTLYGGFLSTFTYNFTPTGPQDKMIVSQARHVWSNALASQVYPGVPHFKINAAHGYLFLKNVMWDKVNGGFITLVDRKGNMKDSLQKTSYGNAFGIFALAKWFMASGDTNALHLAKRCFWWLDYHAHDSIYKGYFQHLQSDGTPIIRTGDIPSTSYLGYKDQNSSIHLLEAFTELYTVWPDSLLRQRLHEMLLLVRDVLTSSIGNLILFFQSDWTPVTYPDSSVAVILKHRHLDHVSFGHDIETAYLLLEAAHVLRFKNDSLTLAVAKRMTDHTLRNGWDHVKGGFWDEGYYFKNTGKISIINNSKNWWTQAEALNTLLLMADYFPNDTMNYFKKFRKQWRYIKTYLIDHRYGDWYAAGTDTSPESKTALKGHTWKAAYHQLRSLTNCVRNLNRKGRYK